MEIVFIFLNLNDLILLLMEYKDNVMISEVSFSARRLCFNHKLSAFNQSYELLKVVYSLLVLSNSSSSIDNIF